MNKEKQIEEMAKDLRNISQKVSDVFMQETHEFLSNKHKYNSLKDFHDAHPKGRALMEAEFLTELGYAKASEVAREIDDLKRYIRLNEDIALRCKEENGEQNCEYWKGKLSAFLQIRGYIDTELKKKYTEDGE